MRIGKMLHSESGKKLTATLSSSSQNNNCSFKRPFGVGVFNIGAELTSSNGIYLHDTDEKEFSFKVYQCEDKEFYQLHDNIIRKQNGKFNPLSAQQHYGKHHSVDKCTVVLRKLVVRRFRKVFFIFQLDVLSPVLPPSSLNRNPVSYTHLTLPTIYSV